MRRVNQTVYCLLYLMSPLSKYFDAVIVGAGVVGLAIGRALSLSGRRVLVLEKERLGAGNSSRSSEVIHAGIHYPLGSLMSRLCIEGRDLLYQYAISRGIPASQVGKLLVATQDEQVEKLKAMEERGKSTEAEATHRIARDYSDHDRWEPTMLNTKGLRLLSPREVAVIEPSVQCVAALWVPSSGIVDTTALMASLANDIRSNRGEIWVGSRLIEGDAAASPVKLLIESSDRGKKLTREIEATWLINSAGIEAHSVASSIHGLSQSFIPSMKFAKGNYFYVDSCPFNHLVYPIPEQGGLGVHFTRDLKGQGKFGPDVEWIEQGQQLDYNVDGSRVDRFYSEVRKYWPGLKDGALRAGYCGIRPKLVGPGEPDADFLIQGPDAHKVEGLINLFGIGSPGLTSSLPIGKLVKRMMD